MSGNHSLSERCSCGATLTLTTDYGPRIMDAANEWRDNHKHHGPDERLAALRRNLVERKAAALVTYERNLFRVGSAVEPGSRDPELEALMSAYDQVLAILPVDL